MIGICADIALYYGHEIGRDIEEREV